LADPAANVSAAVAWHAVMAELGTAVQALQQALDAEHQALDPLDPAALDEATNAKAAVLGQLETLDAERCQLETLHPVDDAVGIWPAIRRQLDVCRRINAINGHIVARRMRGVQRALTVLRGGEHPEPALYGPQGHRQFPVQRRAVAKI
jgi:flagellar biosynthesis/type III secretory pathway chaperone